MTLKNASLLALVGVGLLSALLFAQFLIGAEGWVREIVPAIQVLTSLVHVLASVSVAVFFYVFHKAQG